MNSTLLSNCLIQDGGDISLLNAIRRAMKTGQSSTISDSDATTVELSNNITDNSEEQQTVGETILCVSFKNCTHRL